MLRIATGLLDVVGDQLAYIPYHASIVGLCIVGATAADDIRDNYLLHFWVTFMASWGGGLVSSLLLMKPDEAPVNMLVMQHDILWVGIWWCVNYFPHGLPGSFVRSKPVSLLAIAASQLVRAGTLCNRVSLTLKYYPKAYFAASIMGCIGGSGGKVMHDMIRGGYHIARSSDEVSVPGMSLHSSMLSAAVYCLLVHGLAVLTRGQGMVLVTLFMVAHSLTTAVTGWDFMKSIAANVHAVTNVPEPIPLAAKGKQMEPPKVPQADPSNSTPAETPAGALSEPSKVTQPEPVPVETSKKTE